MLALIVSLAGLIVVSVPLIYFQIRAFDDTYKSELTTITKIASANLAPYIDFDEAEDSIRILENLLVQKDIRTAAVFDMKGRIFGMVGNGNSLPAFAQPYPTATVVRAVASNRVVIQPIEWKGNQRGILVVVGDYGMARGAVVRHLWQSGLGFGALSCVFALGLSAWLQRFVSRPVKNLATIASQIRESADYSLRATRETTDEVGALTDAFNGMLERIASQETALVEARSALEAKVHALAGSEARVQSIISSLAEALILIGNDGVVTLANPRVTPVLGWEPSEIEGCLAAESLFSPNDSSRARELIARAASGTVCSAEMEILTRDGEVRPVEIHWSRLLNADGAPAGILAAFSDITDRRNAAADLAAINTRLVEASRRAGMAEIATNVLHNVGNAFNSVNVSVTLIAEQIRRFKVEKLRSAAELLVSKGSEAGRWLSEDPRGTLFGPYLESLANAMDQDKAFTVGELDQLLRHVEHIKHIIATQQAYAKPRGITERIPLGELISHALELEAAYIANAAADVAGQFSDEHYVIADRHKVVQIVTNIIRNACDSIREHKIECGLISIEVFPERGRVRIEFSDNGGGIAPEHLTKIFAHGFTTRSEGHGFGLHASALAAMEMAGSLTAKSEGCGRGATFILTLPAPRHTLAQQKTASSDASDDSSLNH
jgi:two-component system, LuxR family, sensor kinase FixL